MAARSTLANARTAAEVLDARDLASVAYVAYDTAGNIRGHWVMFGLYIGGLILAGALAFLPGCLMYTVERFAGTAVKPLVSGRARRMSLLHAPT